MKAGYKIFAILGLGFMSTAVTSHAQQTIVSVPNTERVSEKAEEKYVPREPTKKELERNALIAQIDKKWAAVFDNPGNGELHQDIARLYIKLGNADIALNELIRAEALGVDRSLLLADIGKAYFLLGRYQEILEEVSFEAAATDTYGEVYLVRAQAYYAMGDFKQAFFNFYQADVLLQEDRLEFNQPLAVLYNMAGDYDKAEYNVDKALSKDELNADLYALKGELVHRRQGASASYRYFARANFYKPDDIGIESKLAGVLYDLGEKDDAMKVLRKILAQKPDDAYANFMIATLFAEGNNIRTASGYLNRAGDAYNNSVEGLLLKGKLSYATGNYSLSEQALSRLIRIMPDHVNARRILGAALMQQQKYQQAVEVLDYLAEIKKLDITDLTLLGDAYLLAGDDDKASTYLWRASNENMDRLSADQIRQVEEFNSGEEFGVKLDLQSMMNKNPSVNKGLIIETYQNLKKEKYKEAIEKAAALIDQDRASPIGYNLLGLGYMALNNMDAARSNFRRAIDLDNNFNQGRINLAKLELKSGNHNEAVRTLNDILAKDEGYIPAYEQLYELARGSGDLIAAERYLVTATLAKPDLVSVHETLADFYFEDSNFEKAKSLGQKMVQVFPENPLSYKILGKAQLMLEEYIEARDNLFKSKSLNNRDGDVYVMLARAYCLTDEVEKARPLLKDGLKYASDIWPLQIELINLAKTDGDYDGSQLIVSQLKLDPSTRAEAFLLEGKLFLEQGRREDAIKSYQNAAKAGAGTDLVMAGLNQANVNGDTLPDLVQ
ncbi:MAG: tetratricopeptide repeat protein [Kordiimonadaceae bacterium]|nr:tetratricopeptide repeat protein [Kordiimonadaceae bacterium]